MKTRRYIAFLALLIGIASLIFANIPKFAETDQIETQQSTTGNIDPNAPKALDKLTDIEIKGRAPKTGYSRDKFGNGWGKINGCDTRNVILFRDLKSPTMKDECVVATGELNDPYTGNMIKFNRAEDSSAVQIDHVVALSDAWQKGAGSWDAEKRKSFANDPINLLAVDGPANQQKSDGDAATWLPSNKSFRCQYIARQVSIKLKYSLWNTEAETNAMHKILALCPDEPILQ